MSWLRFFVLVYLIFFVLRTSTEWIQVANNVKLEDLENFVVLDLDPATRYHLRVTAHNNAGFSVGEYEFATLTSTGGNCHLNSSVGFALFSSFCRFSLVLF